MTAMAATFCLVFLRAFQQQNVIHRFFGLAAVTSYGIAVAEVGLVLAVVDTGWPSVPWIGTGGALGVTAAMVAHQWVQRNA